LLHAEVPRTETNSDWQTIRDHQPAGLTVKMTLPKDHFFQGEKIEATLDFTNTDPKVSYSMEEPGEFQKSMTDFPARDESGKPVANSLDWQKWFFSMGGLEMVATLGHQVETVPVNRTVRFDQPGTYIFYSRTQGITVEKPTPDGRRSPIIIVSDPVKVTIVPRTDDQEKQAIAAALVKIKAGGRNSWDGIDELGFLQTSAARDELYPFLTDDTYRGRADEAFYAAPDPLVEAARILAAVQSGKLILDERAADFYAELKSSVVFRHDLPDGLSSGDVRNRLTESEKARLAAREEIVAAMLKAAGDNGPSKTEALWTAFKGEIDDHKDKDGGKARAALVAHQLDLPQKHVNELMRFFQTWGSPDFLPLVRRESTGSSPYGLLALAQLKPEEARAGILDGLEYPSSEFFNPGYILPWILPNIPPMPLPEVDPIFRAKLKEGKDTSIVVQLIGCFGSTALLPEVIAAYKKDGAKWDSMSQAAFYFYWMRCDPEVGAKAFEEDIHLHGKDAPSFYVGCMAGPVWNDDALPVVRWAVTSPDVGPYNSVDRLVENGNDADLELAISALEKSGDKRDRASYAARFLKSDRHFTADQEKRLMALADDSGDPIGK
jgi:hypothetical protein